MGSLKSTQNSQCNKVGVGCSLKIRSTRSQIRSEALLKFETKHSVFQIRNEAKVAKFETLGNILKQITVLANEVKTTILTVRHHKREPRGQPFPSR